MAQILLYIEAIYILLPVLYSTSNGCLSVTVETSDEIVNASQNFSVVCEADCGFLHYEVIYSGDPATGTPPSGIVDLNGMGKKSTYIENLKAHVLMKSDHSVFQGCNKGGSINSTLYVKAPSPGKYYFHCYTETDPNTCDDYIYSKAKEVKVLRDEEVSTPGSSSVSSTITTTAARSSTSTSSLHIVTTTIPTSVGTSSSQGTYEVNTESIMSTQTSSLNPVQVSTVFLTNTVTSTSTVCMTSHCTAASTTTISSIAVLDSTLQPVVFDTIIDVQPSSSNKLDDLYHIEKKIMIGTVSVVGILLLLAMIGTVTVLIMACKFARRIRSQSKLL